MAIFMHVSPASGRFASTPLPGLCARPHFAPPRPVPNSWLSHCTEIKFQSMQVSLKHAALERIICDQQYDYVAQFTNEHQSLCSFAALILERIIHYIPVSEKSFEPDQQMWSYIACISSIVQKQKM